MRFSKSIRDLRAEHVQNVSEIIGARKRVVLRRWLAKRGCPRHVLTGLNLLALRELVKWQRIGISS